jgi:hypothetical protein
MCPGCVCCMRRALYLVRNMSSEALRGPVWAPEASIRYTVCLGGVECLAVRWDPRCMHVHWSLRGPAGSMESGVGV